MQIGIHTVQNDSQLEQILSLQASNLRLTHPQEHEAVEGFVTVRHSLPLLQALQSELPQVVALAGDEVIGYALAMPSHYRTEIPELFEMFAVLDNLDWEGRPFKSYNYLVMGQICIAAAWRKKGVFKQLYQHYFTCYRRQFDWIVTEVAARNTRSLNAHLSVGFVPAHRYTEENVEEWVVLVY